MKLRDYQRTGVRSIWNAIAAEKKKAVVCAMPTGVGKSLVNADLAGGIVKTYPGQRIACVTHSQILVGQNAEKFGILYPDIPYGVVSAGLGRKEYGRPVTFAGIGSVARHPERLGKINILIVDECHAIGADNRSMYHKLIAALRKLNPKLVIIGLTATPYRMGMGMLTDGDIFTDICIDMTTPEWIEWFVQQGYLVPLVAKKTQNFIDTSDVKIVAGDYQQSGLSNAAMRGDMTEKAITEALPLIMDRRSVAIYCVSIEHVQQVVLALDAVGIECEYTHSKRTDDDNKAALARFESGQSRFIASMGQLCLDEHTEVLTEEGFVSIDKMTTDHRLAAWDMDGSVEFTKNKFLIKRPLEQHEHLVHFNNQGYALASVTGNHRMVVGNHYSGEKFSWVERSADECHDLSASGNSITLPAHGMLKEIPRFTMQLPFPYDADKRRVLINKISSRIKDREEATRRIDAKIALRYKAPHELTLDECKFIGFWLADGTVSKQLNSSDKYELGQSERYPEHVAEIDRLIAVLGVDCTRHTLRNDKSPHLQVRWRIPKGTGSGVQERAGILPYIPYLVKDGSSYYHGFNREQLLALLDGFYLGDGDKDKTNCVTNTNLELLDLLQRLCVVRGIRCTITDPYTDAKSTRPVYKIMWQPDRAWTIKETYVEKATTDKPKRVWCVTSTTSYLICRKFGRVFVTGNTTGWDCPRLDCIIMLRPTRSPGLWVQMLGRGTRPFFCLDAYQCADGVWRVPDLSTTSGRLMAIATSQKHACLVLDFARNTEDIGPFDDPQIPKKRKGGGGNPIMKACQKGRMVDKEYRGCGRYAWPAERHCKECGHEFYFEVKFDSSTTGTAIMGKRKVPKEDEPIPTKDFPVSSVTYNIHTKPGKPDSIRVNYICGLRKFSTFLCPDHGGGATARARMWWRKHIDDHPPHGIAAWYERMNEARIPLGIEVLLKKDWPDVRGWRFEPLEEVA